MTLGDPEEPDSRRGQPHSHPAQQNNSAPTDLNCEILSERLGRTATLSDAGLDRRGNAEDEGTPLAQPADTATALWRSDRKRAMALHLAPPARGPA